MRCNIRYLVSLLLFAMLIGGICFIRAQVPPDAIKGPVRSGKTECDMKKKVKLPWCPECKKILIGFRCEDCAQKDGATCNDGLFPKEKIKDSKCPCCGSENLTETELVIDKKCFYCNNPVERIEHCVKKVYACPNHPDYKHVKEGKCREWITDAKGKKKRCNKNLELIETVYSKILTSYICPKCGEKYEERGKCPTCKKVLRKKKICEKSGTFPHVNGSNWEKMLKEKYRKPE